MTIATTLRPASRATRIFETATRTPLSSCCFVSKKIPHASFAGVHTTSSKPQEAAALRQDPDDVVRRVKSTQTITKPTLDYVRHSLRSLSHSTRELTKQVVESSDILRHPLRYEIPEGKPHLLHAVSTSTGKPRGIFDAAWLRDRCPCPQCVSPSSGNKSFSTGEIPAGIRFADVQKLPDGSVQIRWDNDIPRAATAEHVSVFPHTGPNAICAMRFEKPVLFANHNWERDHMTKFCWTNKRLTPRLLRMDYRDFVAGRKSFRDAVVSLAQIGLLFLTNVPQTETAVADIALKFGAIKETFYGRTWDVISKPDAENVAYTSSYLGLHSDMLYLESPPRIQLLHCLENSCAGGESIFSDALNACNYFHRHQPDHYKALCEFQVPYHYARNGFFYRQARPVIAHSKDHMSREVWWSPPFQASFPVTKTQEDWTAWRKWLAAARRFQRFFESPVNVFQYKLRPGECVLFDNRRVLHGRRAFDTGSGRRWLKGTYVADEDFKSTLRGIL